MNHHCYQQRISSKQERAKEDGFPDHHRKDSNIHRIANPLIGSLFDKDYRRIDGRRRSFSNEGERSRTPEIESNSQQQREKTNHPDGWKQKHWACRTLQQEPGDNPGYRPRNQDREHERFQSDHNTPSHFRNVLYGTFIEHRTANVKGEGTGDSPEVRKRSFALLRMTRPPPGRSRGILFNKGVYFDRPR
ncbi:MAG: hypothetical protein AUG82_02095 [Ktedonobacter sp. 13_1_20CM_4_53_11]|nr:MAG: hypothetical protein AUG82_02095 [Ktedonobacter sp. 13_1_20CM_4_53_11]